MPKSICSFGYFFLVWFVWVLFFAMPIKTYAAGDFKTSYSIEYYINENDATGLTKASYTIKLANTKPDLVVKTFTISFPKSFGISSMQARDDYGMVVPEIIEKDRTIDVSLTFSNPQAGLNETNSLYIDFLQRNIFRSEGTVWEVLIPTMDGRQVETQSVTIYLPPGKHSKLSIAKPIPSQVSFDKVVWNNAGGHSLYAVFGESQHYKLLLQYELNNPNLYRVYTDVAFPPETLYQQIYVDSIAPKPDSVYTDSDGNYMGRYYLNPKEQKFITFQGEAELFALPRESFEKIARSQFIEQRMTLFNNQPLWQLKNDNQPLLTTPYEVYSYVLSTLQYNFGRVITGNSRMGAQAALMYPDQAVCTEYSDLFVATARKERIYAREIQGFAYEQEQELRPIQTQSDILHSWVEYYDEKKQIWIPVDPTWEDTSGIDYFSSLDLNHIVFAVHGKQADYPYPAGSYKLEKNGTYVHVEPTTTLPSIRNKLVVSMSNTAIPTHDEEFSTKLSITNNGSTALWNESIRITCNDCATESTVIPLANLYPYETKTVEYTFKPRINGLIKQIQVSTQYQNKTLYTAQVAVPTFVPIMHAYVLPLLIMASGGILLLYILKKRNDN